MKTDFEIDLLADVFIRFQLEPQWQAIVASSPTVTMQTGDLSYHAFRCGLLAGYRAALKNDRDAEIMRQEVDANGGKIPEKYLDNCGPVNISRTCPRCGKADEGTKHTILCDTCKHFQSRAIAERSEVKEAIAEALIEALAD